MKCINIVQNTISECSMVNTYQCIVQCSTWRRVKCSMQGNTKRWVTGKTFWLRLNWLIKAASQMTMKQSLQETNEREPPTKFSLEDIGLSCCQVCRSVTLPNFSCLPLFSDKSVSSTETNHLFYLKQITLYEFSCWLPVDHSGHFGRKSFLWQDSHVSFINSRLHVKQGALMQLRSIISP